MVPWRRRVVMVGFCVAMAVGLLLGVQARPAAADDRDVVDAWAFDLQVDPRGILKVTETLVYRFGQNSGRHGIIRDLVVREPYDDQRDAVYDIDDITVSSPNASAEFTRTVRDNGRLLSLRIGSQDRTVTTPTATYTISYTVKGAMRTFQGYDELYWDLISAEAPRTRRTTISVTVPGGVLEVACSSAAPGESRPCTSATVGDQRGSIVHEGRPAGEILTIAAKIPPGQVSDNAPHLVGRERDLVSDLAGLGWSLPALTTALAAVGAWVRVRRKGRDLRFLDLPPGVMPRGGTRERVGLSAAVDVPVAFSPPAISVAEAGLLADGQVDTRETTATLVDLAVRGVIEISADEYDDVTMTLLDPSRASASHEHVLIQHLFHDIPIGEPVEFASKGAMHEAHQALVASVTNQVSTRGWFTDVPRPSAGLGLGLGVAVGLIFMVINGGFGLWLPLVAAVAGPALAWAWSSARLSRGQRTAVGRALTDQVEGFDTYLTTAESDQLRFEEGEDLFSRYLPWAIIFEVADRWYEVCQPLMLEGRMAMPSWNHGALDAYSLTSVLDDLASPPPSSSSGSGLSGTGFGGGSAFSGGGITSGGGGGGGSVSSW